MIIIFLKPQTPRRDFQIVVEDADALFEIAWALSETGRSYRVWETGAWRSSVDYNFGDLSGWVRAEK